MMPIDDRPKVCPKCGGDNGKTKNSAGDEILNPLKAYIINYRPHYLCGECMGLFVQRVSTVVYYFYNEYDTDAEDGDKDDTNAESEG